MVSRYELMKKVSILTMSAILEREALLLSLKITSEVCLSNNGNSYVRGSVTRLCKINGNLKVAVWLGKMLKVTWKMHRKTKVDMNMDMHIKVDMNMEVNMGKI